MLACVAAVTHTLRPILQEFQLVFDVRTPRIDVRLPLSDFGVEGGENIALQPVEPLEMVHTKDGVPEDALFSEALKSLAEQSSFESVKALVATQANARNTLLYASDCALPVSRATLADLKTRRDRELTLLILTVMGWQRRVIKHSSGKRF